MDVAGKVNSRISGAFFPYRFDIACGLGMVTAGNDKPGLRKGSRNGFKGLDHQLQPLVRSPLAKGKDPVRVAAA